MKIYPEKRKKVGFDLLSFFTRHKKRSFALLLVFGSLIYLVYYFWEPLAANFRYYFKTTVVSNSFIRKVASLPEPDLSAYQNPISEEFNLVIKKIDVNVPVVANVKAEEPKEYFYALTKGVAHYARTTLKGKGDKEVTVDGSLPGEGGNIFIFGHSNSPGSGDSRYRSIFTLLDKLDKGDEIELTYQKEKIAYKVKETKIISADDLSVLERTSQETLTLMTCWPFGTNLKRLIVRAERS
jgi:LPXTG-site transpeptidase (sortase) family protein